MYGFGAMIKQLKENPKTIVFTEGSDPRILEAASRLLASNFLSPVLVGKEDEKSQAAIKRIVDEGHTLGMHSYSHKYMELYESLDSFKEDFEKQQNYLEELTGVKCKYYRFPGGSSNTVSKQDMRFFAYYLDSQDVVFYDWNVDSGDAANRHISIDLLVQNSTATIPRWKTSVVLMHDAADKRATVDALPKIIEMIQAMEDTELLPITEDTVPVQHLHR